MPAEPLSFEHFEIARREDGSPYELGRGAMGVTYKALDTRLGSFVALKVINSDYLNNEVARERFLREARAAAHLNHPNVAAIFHRGQDGGAYFYAMQFIEGETLDAFVKRRGPLPAALALRLILQATQGLAAANERGLIHRDIKPANLMLVHQGGHDGDDDDLLVKIIDFGLAKTMRAPEEAATMDVSLTGGGPIGTPHYMSPEQIDPGSGEIDARTDIYSLGVTLWYLLAGKPPFIGSQFQVFNQHMHKPPPLEQLADLAPPVVGGLLSRMLAKDPGERPANHRELIGELKALLRDPAVLAATPVNPADPYAPIYTPDQSTFEQQQSGADSTIPDDSLLAAGQVSAVATAGANATLADPPAAPAPAPLPSSAPSLSAARVGGITERDFSLTEILRRRGALPVGETILLLEVLTPLAAAAPMAPGGLDALCPDGIRVVFESPAPPDLAELPARPVGGWPEWTLDFVEEPADAGDDIGATMAPRPRGSGGTAKDAPRRLAALIYELLKGAPPPTQESARATLPPLPSLNEAGNTVLRRALAGGPQGFGTTREFREAMLRAVGSSGAAAASKPATPPARGITPAPTPVVTTAAVPVRTTIPAAPPLSPAPAPASWPLPPTAPAPAAPRLSAPTAMLESAPAAPARRRTMVIALGASIGLLLLSNIGWFIWHHRPKANQANPGNHASPAASPAPSVVPASSPGQNPKLAALALSSPAASVAPSPTPSPKAAASPKTGATKGKAVSVAPSPMGLSSPTGASPTPAALVSPTPRPALSPTAPRAYQGSVGGRYAEYSLQWADGGAVSGTYSYPGSSDKTVYTLKGTNKGNGTMELKEYTGSQVSATLKLTKSIQNGEIVWSGKMLNTDGKRFDMVMKRKQDAPGGNAN